MQQSTIFSILMILVSKRKVSRDFLAERFSISKRTVSRYLRILEDSGVPLVSESGVGGGVSLSDDYVLDKSFFTEAETIRIKDALEKTRSSYDDNVNLALMEKIDCVNRSREQDNYIIKQSDLFIDGEYGQAELLRPRIKKISEAIEKSRALDINYTDAHGLLSYRTVDPYTLVFKAGAWYMYALCRLRGDFRLFKLSRITDMRMTSKSFTRYESKLLEKLELEYYNEIYVDLEFEFYPTVRESVVDWLSMSAVTERGAKLVARAEVPLTDELIKRLLSFGSSIKVLTPEIAERMRDEAIRMADAYKR